MIIESDSTFFFHSVLRTVKFYCSVLIFNRCYYKEILAEWWGFFFVISCIIRVN